MADVEVISRRAALSCIGWASAAALLPARRGVAAAAGRSDLIAQIERHIVHGPWTDGTTWFHPKCTAVPGNTPHVLMTLQSITGSDVFGPVHFATSTDGIDWTAPAPIAGLGRTQREDGTQRGVCDVVPEYHAPTQTVLAMGHEVFYRDEKLFRPQPRRLPVYVVRDGAGRWSEPRVFEWDHPRGSGMYTSNCSQRVNLPGGDVLVPMCFHPADDEARAAATARCSFDGRTLAIREVGNFLERPVKRGLLEPSMTTLDGRFYLTLRAEDERGYVSTSDDGLHWSPIQPWAWDDGEELVMSTTQQHWVTHSDALYLSYTRRTERNGKVARYRAPLFIAEVDRATMRLIRDSERVLLPMIGDGEKDPEGVMRMGNFHPVNVSPDETWVTVGAWRYPKVSGLLLLAKIRWAKGNRLVA